MDIPTERFSGSLHYSHYFLLHCPSTPVAGLGVLKFHFYVILNILYFQLITVCYVLTCKIKLSNSSFTTWYIHWTLTSLTSGSNSLCFTHTFITPCTLIQMTKATTSNLMLRLQISPLGFEPWANLDNNEIYKRLAVNLWLP